MTPKQAALIIGSMLVAQLGFLTLAVLNGRTIPSGNYMSLDANHTIPHPEIGGEYDPKTGEIHVPKITLLQVEANGKTFFIRAAETSHDAKMLFRTKEPVEDQLRFDREPSSD